MSHSQVITAGPAFDGVSDDALLLHEMSHRVANEVASAAAALRLAKGSVTGGGHRLLEHALRRLEAFGELSRVLARPVRSTINVSHELTAVCRAIAAGATGAASSTVSLNVPELWVDGDTARRIVLVAAELMANSVRHALDGRAGQLEVSLEVVEYDVVLQVKDDGPGIRAAAATRGTGLGGGIVAQLVTRARGTVVVDSGPHGVTVRVALPLATDPGGDDEIVF